MTDPVNIYRPKAKKNPPSSNAKTEKTTDELAERREAIDEKVAQMPTEYGGRPADKGLEPTRYDDWELKGRCIDF